MAARKSKEGADSGMAIQPRLPDAWVSSRIPGDNLPVNNWWQLLVTKRNWLGCTRFCFWLGGYWSPFLIPCIRWLRHVCHSTTETFPLFSSCEVALSLHCTCGGSCLFLSWLKTARSPFPGLNAPDPEPTWLKRALLRSNPCGVPVASCRWSVEVGLHGATTGEYGHCHVMEDGL